MAAMTDSLHPRAGVRPGVLARLLLGLAALGNLMFLSILLFRSASYSDPLILAGRTLGLFGALLMAGQLVLVARLPWLDRRIGMDRLTSWHRRTGFTLLCLVLAHVGCVVMGYSAASGTSPVAQVLDLSRTYDGVLRAIVAVWLFVVVGVSSARFARRRMPYEVWHVVHLVTYAAVLLAFTHQLAVGTTFATSPAAIVYWWSVWSVAWACLVAGRFALPIWRNVRHQLRVESVHQESADVVSIRITGRRLDRLPAEAGQFFLWRFAVPALWWQAHPFSLSAAPDGRSLRITVKALGSGTAKLSTITPGTRVFIEGPYGAFTPKQRTRSGTLLIAGGVGITPVRALLEELRGDVTVIYRSRSEADAVLSRELQGLAAERDAVVVHLLIGTSESLGAAGAVLGARSLSWLVPDIVDRDVYVCGPPGMMQAVLDTLRELGVPKKQVHAERFSLAG